MADIEKEVILSVKNLDVVFGKGKKKFKAVSNVSFDIYKGETLSLVGESGSGKTTIGRAIMRINPCSSGEIIYKGKRISGKLSRKEDREVIRENVVDMCERLLCNPVIHDYKINVIPQNMACGK